MFILFTSIRFVMALLTVLAIVGKPLIPPKTLVLHPSEYSDEALYGPLNADNQPVISWQDNSIYSLRCELPVPHNPLACGIVFKWNQTDESACVHRTQFNRCSTALLDSDRDGWGTENGSDCVVMKEGTMRTLSGNPLCTHFASDPDGDGWGWEDGESCIVVNAEEEAPNSFACTSGAIDPDGDGWGWENEQSCRMKEPEQTTPCAHSASTASVDATGYDGLLVKVHYEGRSSYLRLNVTDTAPELYAVGIKPKPMSTFISTEDLRTGRVFISLDEFSVEEWWTIAQNPPRHIAAPSFGHVTDVAFDTYDRGVHRLRVAEITLIGKRIDTETYLFAIAMLWVGFLLLESGYRYYRLRAAYRHEQKLLVGLVGGAHTLEAEKVQLKGRTHTDPLTGTLNRNGLFERMQQQYGSQQLQAGIGLLVFDIDHFKAINDTHGHEAGDRVLQDFSALLTSAIRAEDMFARWGGEEFLLVVDHVSQEKLMGIGEKLRQLVADHAFLDDKGPTVTVSIGASRARVDEHFDALFKRADKALYQAKITRNTVKYAP